jgi:hypothetical protein
LSSRSISAAVFPRPFRKRPDHAANAPGSVSLATRMPSAVGLST